MSGSAGMQREFERWPKYKNAYLRTFARMIEERKKKGLTEGKSKWDTPEEVMDWWMYGTKEEDNEPSLFDDLDIDDLDIDD